MLRMSYMPSDFHPVLLVLGNADELMVLADALEAFSESGKSVVLNDVGVYSTDTHVTLEECDLDSDVKPGLWKARPGATDLVWRLPKRYAWIFSNEVANLATSGEPAGSVTLECEVIREIKVKVSIGEWEDHYLTDETR